MKALITSSLFLVFACTTALSAQWGVMFQDDFTERTCPYDTTVTGFFPNAYEVFQTLDGTYDGTIDSSWCPFFNEVWPGRIELDMDTYDFSRPLFVRLRLPENFASTLQPYSDYDLRPTRNLLFMNSMNSVNCLDDCSQIHLRYRAVDDLTQDTIYRDFEFDSPDASICFFSERFSDQKVTEIGETLWLSRNGALPRILFFGYGIQPTSFTGLQRRAVDSILFTNTQIDSDGTYRAFPSEVVTPEPDLNNPAYYYAPQFEDRVPSPVNIRYLEATVEGDPDTVVRLQLNFDEYDDIALPPYTGLAGAKVAGQDSLRHELTVSFENMYRSTCEFYITTDRPLPQNTYYEFGEAEIAFGEDAACLVLESGSGLRVRPDKNFHYGRNGQGLLAAKEESSITINTGATLTFHNTLRLLHPVSFAEGGMHIYLEEGSTLRFGDMANVERKHSEANVWIYVHGKEENVDFGPLTAEERALFRFVASTTTPLPIPLNEIHAFPNPVRAGNVLSIIFPQTEEEGEKHYTLYSMQGKAVTTGALFISQHRKSEISFPAQLAEGVYFLQVRGSNREYSARLFMVSSR